MYSTLIFYFLHTKGAGFYSRLTVFIPFQDSRGSYPDLGPDAEHISSGVSRARGERGMTDHGHSSKQLSRYHPRSRESYSSRGSHDSYSQETQVMGGRMGNPCMFIMHLISYLDTSQ